MSQAFTASPGLVLDSSDSAITGTVAPGDAAAGPYSVSVTATDGTYTQSVAFTWNVSSAISLTNPGTQSKAEGASVSLALSATDSTSGATLSYAALGLPPGLAINPSTGVISGTSPAAYRMRPAARASARRPFIPLVSVGVLVSTELRLPIGVCQLACSPSGTAGKPDFH